MSTVENLQLLCDQAIALHQKGNRAEAERLYMRILAVEPSSFVPLHMLGVIRYEQGRNHEALELIDIALKINPGVASAYSNLGLVLARLGRFEDALAGYEKALVIDRNYADAWNNRGMAFAGLKRFKEALASYDHALTIKQNHAEAWNNRGVALSSLNRFREALASYDKALSVKPGYAMAWSNRGTALQNLNRFGEALASFDKALSINPDYAEAWNNRGATLRELKRFAEGLASFEKALLIKQDYADAWNNRGVALREMGKFDKAREAYIRALTLDPSLANAYLNYADSIKFTAKSPYLKPMEAMRTGAIPLSEYDRLQLDFALAKAHADLKQYTRSFRYLLSGNALKRAQVPYNEVGTLALFDRIENTITANALREKERLEGGFDSPTPIFVLGMPRSGSTLVEQILASHPDVHGAGELRTFSDMVDEIHRSKSDTDSYPEFVPELDARALGQLGMRYLEEVHQLAPKAQRIVDKMPGNYLFVGLIHLALPNARIIHTVRDPTDTCLSCFSRLFSGDRHSYTYDLAELGRYYRRYQKLMAHWRSVLPHGRFLEVRYEDVVADLNGQARRLVAHCGLGWDEHCLSFHSTDRPVRTASARQVRQPIYRSAVGHAHAYEEFLSPLKEALEGSLVP